MIPFNIPPSVGTELSYVGQAIENKKICGDGEFTKKCRALLSDVCRNEKVLLTTSCTHALEMAALLCDIQDGDEVILPSFTFCSTADAFVQRGARLVFVDIRPDTMNIDEKKIERAVTERTKVIIPVHYAGVSCEMDEINAIAKRHGLKVVEDAAQAIFSTYKGKPLGTLGDYGCFSFHETKNLSMGEGGAIVVNTDTVDFEEAEIIREKGTDRSRFFRGQVDKYTWVAYGSSYLPSELNAAYLFAQLEKSGVIQENRMRVWNLYNEALAPLARAGRIEVPFVPEGCVHNAHMFCIKCADFAERSAFIAFMKERGISCPFHYIPLHSAPAGKKYGRFDGEDEFTTKESERLVRLPLFYGLSDDDAEKVISAVKEFYERH